MIFKKTIAVLSAASMLGGGIPVLAAFTPDSGADGFSMGYYEEEWNEADRKETESLYSKRPKAERQMENLNRGLTAVPGDGGTLVSWRFLGTDSSSVYYNLYRNGEKINNSPINASNYFDADAPAGAEYTLAEVKDGTETGVKVMVKAWDKEYISIPVKEREGYIIDDGAVGDLDGDGEYEYIIRRTPVNMEPATRTAYPLIEAYKQDGTHLWTIDIGPNEINEVDINFLVYDMDGDGKSEMIMRSFEGTSDGAGNKIGDENGDGITDYSKDTANLAIFKDRQYIVSTPEFLSVYDGVTGVEKARTDLLPAKEPLTDWSYRYTDTGRLTKRASHYLFGLAYLDGITPSVVMVRGAWDNVRAAAWHISDDKFVLDWEHKTANTDDVDSIWGACNHNLCVADIDFDGKDEIISGPMAMDHDGSELYAVKGTDNDGKEQKFLHGDAFDLAKMDPDYNGYLVWACHENAPILGNIELHDGRTGQVKFGYSKNKDTGRSRAGDIDPNYKGFEVWGSTGTIPMNFTGEKIADNFNQFKYRLPDGTYEKDSEGKDAVGTLPMNFKVYWDGDLLSEFLDGTRVSKWNWEDKLVDVIFDADGSASNGGTKAVPVVSADLFGDWREEIVWKSSDEKELRVYSTAIPTGYKLPTLMQDYYYRSSVAVQNNHYNQPPNVSYYLGAETTDVPLFEGYVMSGGQKLVNPELTDAHGTYKIGNGKTAASKLELLIDSPYAYVGSKFTKIDTADDRVVPFVADGDRTLVPVRFISESFGMDVGFDDATRVITLSGNGYDIVMTLDSAEYTVNGEKKMLDVTARSYNGRTMIPLRAMAEAIGKKVFWDPTGYIFIGDKEFNDKALISKKVEILKTGVEPVPTPSPTPEATPEPTATPNPLDSMTYTDYKDSKGNVWKLYIDEDFSGYSAGDAAGWAGTKPAPLDNIGVTASKTLGISGSSKGNRNAIYRLPAPMTNKAIIELDWKNGAVTGGSSVGELRFADSNNHVFFAFKTAENMEMQYSWGGAISNGALETAEWKNVGIGFNKDAVYHVVITADFNTNTAEFTISNGSNVGKGSVNFAEASDFGAIEVLAVRQEKNFDWATELDNIKIGMQ
ncbi:MAG: stalk domain-containing protein [Clostridia bacterium]|nr:stalk domain-containing protein [Clostridia bacterium]